MFHLNVKPRPPVVGGARDLRPRRRFLGHGDRARAGDVRRLVQALQERDGLEVLVAAVLVRRPLMLFARVVEIEHRGDGVDAQPVEMEVLEPTDRARQQEALHLVPRVVEHERVPVGVLAFLRIGVLVQRGAVEARERVVVLREVTGDPVEQHADALPVQLGDELAQLVGRAVPARRREVARALIAPRVVERMLRDRQQLDVREAEILDVRGELARELAIAQEIAGRVCAATIPSAARRPRSAP